MKHIKIIFLIYFTITLTNGYEGSSREESIKVALELYNMDIEDKCNELSTVRKQFILNNTNATLYKVIDMEEEIGKFIKTESKRLRDTHDVSDRVLSETVQRQWDIASNMGDAELPEKSLNQQIFFKHSRESTNIIIPCLNKTEKCTLNKNDITNILSTSRNAKDLKNVWIAVQDVYSKSKPEEYQDILKLVQKTAEANGMESPTKYWEHLTEYEGAIQRASDLWDEIEPLYNKFHSFVKTRLEQHYSEIRNSETIPVYLLGSKFGEDWTNIAPLVLPHRYLYDEITSMLDFDKIGGKKVYEIAEKFTNNMGLGKARNEFWQNSIFNQTCPSQMLTFCGDKYTSVITCNSTGWKEYLDAHEDMIRVVLNDMDYPSTALNAYRVSALDEALASLSSILAVKNLPQAGVVPESVFEEDNSNDNQMTALMLTALRILPKLPYYFLADKWRLEQLSEDITEAPIKLWWDLRESIQRVSGVSKTEPDFLGDGYITSNKPYIGKFLGTILQFQILEFINSENTGGLNILTYISQDTHINAMIKQRSTHSWSQAVSNNIYYEVDTDALLNYFKPLEEYMDFAPVEQVTQTVIPKTTTTTSTTTTTTTTTTTSTAIPPKLLQAQESIPELPKDEPQQTQERERVVEEAKKPANIPIQPTEPPSSASTVATWAGALIGVGSLVIIIAVFARRHFKRKPLPHNRRHEV